MSAKFNLLHRYGPLILFTIAGFLVWLRFQQVNSQGLQYPDAFRYASIARNIAQGNEFTEAQIWPYRFAFEATSSPPFYVNRTQPFHPLAIAGWFHLRGISESSTVWASGFWFWLLIPLVYLFGRRVWGKEAAWVAGILVLLDRTLLNYSISGLTEPAFMFFLTLSLFLAYSARHNWHMVVTGLFWGVAWLVRPEPLLFLLPTGLLIYFLSRNWRWMACSVIGIGVIMIPYWIWCALIFGNPFFELNSVLLVGYSSVFPDGSVCGLTKQISTLAFVCQNPGVILSKLNAGLERYYRELPHLINPYAMPAFFASLVGIRFIKGNHQTEPVKRARLLLWLCVLIGMEIIIASLTSGITQGLRFLVHFIPLILIFVAGALVEGVRLVMRSKHWQQLVVLLLVVGFLCVPTIYYDLTKNVQQYSQAKPKWQEMGKIIRENTAPGDLIMTYWSNQLAWYGERQTIAMPFSFSELLQKVQVDAVLLTSESQRLPQELLTAFETGQLLGYQLQVKKSVNGEQIALFLRDNPY